MQIAKTNDYNVKPWSEIIDGEIARMTELTAEFLQFSRPHLSNFKPEPIEECISRVVHLTQSQALMLGHQILITYRNSVPLYINMDKDKIVQVLINIVKNGLEAMNENGTIHIRLSHNGNNAVIEIEDTGRGIPKSELEKIFNPFYTTKQNGTGLGLSICYKIIQDHQGKMEIESILHQGTIFRIILPLS